MRTVTVVVPAYNKADYTIRAISSVLAQTYGKIEILVIDDGSTDDTRRKIESFGCKIRYIHKKNSGACSARNLGIKKATGELIAFLDCDDIYYPEKIAKSVEKFESNPEIGFVSTGAYRIDENDDIVTPVLRQGILPEGWIYESLIQSNLVCNSTVVVKKDCFCEVGDFDESIFIPGDWDMWIRLAKRFQAGYVSEPLTGYRISNGYTIKNLEEGLSEAVYVLKKHQANDAKLSRKILTRAYANLYFRYGRLFGANGNNSKIRDLFSKVFLSDPFNRNAFYAACGYFLSIINPAYLQKLLSNRYLPKEVKNNSPNKVE